MNNFPLNYPTPLRFILLMVGGNKQQSSLRIYKLDMDRAS